MSHVWPGPACEISYVLGERGAVKYGCGPLPSSAREECIGPQLREIVLGSRLCPIHWGQWAAMPKLFDHKHMRWCLHFAFAA